MGRTIPVMSKDTVTGDPFDEALARALRRRIALDELKIPDVAVSAGLLPRTLRRYLSGERTMPMSRFVAVCTAMGVDAGEIIESALDILKVTQEQPGVDSGDA